MGRVILPCGKDAGTPYRLEGLRVQVSNVEELCYVLRKNAFMLESSLMDKALTAWIDGECGLKELSRLLQAQLAQKGSLCTFVMTILEYVGFYDHETLQETEQLLRQGENLSSYEKEKVFIDELVQKGRYEQALEEYGGLLRKLPEVENMLSAKVLHNMGTAYAGLFRFGRAAEYFWRAFEMHPLQETYLHYLGAKRMELTDKEYVDFIANLPDAYRDSLELEKRVEAYRKAWSESDEWKRLENGRTEPENLLLGMKQRYRKECGEI